MHVGVRIQQSLKLRDMKVEMFSSTLNFKNPGSAVLEHAHAQSDGPVLGQLCGSEPTSISCNAKRHVAVSIH